ncbi:MAG: hypothetical protein AAB288_01080 [Acidobacteriota bacterium]
MLALWQSELTKLTYQITLDKGELRFDGDALTPTPDGSFTIEDAELTFKFRSTARAEMLDFDGSATPLTKVTAWNPTQAELATFAGEWRSDEAQATMKFSLERDKPFLVFSPFWKIAMKPTLKDHFSGGIYVVWFTRNRTGKITQLHVGRHRLRDMVFYRLRK